MRFKGKHRVKKADLKEDRFQMTVEKIAEFYYKDRQRVWVIGGVALAVVVGGILLLQNRGSGVNVEAEMRFTEALGIFTQGNVEQAEEAFGSVAGRFGKDPVGAKATYYLGQIYFSTQRFSEAREEFAKSAGRLKNHPALGPGALMGIADCDVELGNGLKAAEGYERAYRRYPDSPLANTAMMAAGRSYVSAGVYDKAEAVYQELLDKEPGGQEADELKVQLSYVRTLRSKF